MISARPSRRFCWLALLAYVAAVAVVASRHELFRDEVRALNIAAGSRSLGDLWHNLHNEGHPALWYVLLWLCFRVTGTMLVLKPLSLAVAAFAVWLFLREAPFRPWQKVLFAFGALPVYEYSVMCRNYGISMLLLFGIGALWRRRFERPLGLAGLLALLANANAPSLILVAALVTGMFLELTFRPPSGVGRQLLPRGLAALAVVAAGVGVAVVCIWPDRTSIVLPEQAWTLRDLPAAVLQALWAPTRCFVRVAGAGGERGLRVGLVLLLVHFARKPWLAATLFLAAVGFSVFDQVIYDLDYRHSGLLLVLALLLVWIDRTTEGAVQPPPLLERAGAWLARGGEAALALSLCGQIALAAPDVVGDLWGQRSSVASVASYLAEQPRLRDAVVVAEPDPLIEALPYYAPNRIYQPRERRFMQQVHFTTANQRVLTLDELMASLDWLAASTRVPIVLALTHPLGAAGPFEIGFAYGKRFVYSASSREAFLSRAVLLGTFDHAQGRENFSLYEWPASTTPAVGNRRRE